MAQPKILANLSKLEKVGFLDGSCLMVSLNQDPNALDNIIEYGTYLFEGTPTIPLPCTGSCAWILRVYAPNPNNEKNITDFDNYIIQEAERLGTTADGTNSRVIAYREYTGREWSDWYEGGGGSKVECDTSISTTSENPVQNKVIAAALNNKLNKSGGTLTGALTAQANTNYTTYQVRNIALNTTAATPTGNGSILGVYTV